MKKETPDDIKSFSEEESVVGLFAAVMFKNSENYMIGLLNKLIHCLMTV